MVDPRDLKSSYRPDRETSRATQGLARRRWATVVATGCRWIGGAKRTNRRIRVPASRLQCTIEDKLTLEKVDGREVERYETKVTTGDGHVTKYLKDVPNS